MVRKLNEELNHRCNIADYLMLDNVWFDCHPSGNIEIFRNFRTFAYIEYQLIIKNYGINKRNKKQ